MKKMELTCVVCPNGCRLCYEEDGTVSGAKCKRGIAYAEQERTQPMRTLTLTLRTEAGALVPVRSLQPIPRERTMEAVAILQKITLPNRDFTCGEVLVEDLMGAKLIATADIPAV